MMRNYRIRSAWLVAAVSLAGAGCSDAGTSTAPVAARPTTPLTAVAPNPGRRGPYIADLQLSSIYVSLSEGYTPFAVTVTNPTRKNFYNIYLKGVLQSGNNAPWPATAFLAYCPNPNGVVRPADCAMSNGITALGGETLVVGPATYTLTVLQQQPDGSMKVLDSKTVDVVLTRTVVFER